MTGRTGVFISPTHTGQSGLPLNGAATMSQRKVCDRQTLRCLNDIFDDMCRISQGSFWSWFAVNRYTFHEDKSEKSLLHFLFLVTLPFDLLPLNFLSQLLGSYVHQIWSFYYSSPSPSKSKVRDRWTDRQGATLNAALRGPHKRLSCWREFARFPTKFRSIVALCLSLSLFNHTLAMNMNYSSRAVFIAESVK